MPAWAPTAPPDIGASMNWASNVSRASFATWREDLGSILEQSIKIRLSSSCGRAPFAVIEVMVSLTIWGEGRLVIMTLCDMSGIWYT